MDPVQNQSEKQDLDTDPHQRENVEFLEGHFGALVGLSLGKSEQQDTARIRNKLIGRIRIRIKVKCRIRIRIKVMRIRNTVSK